MKRHTVHVIYEHGVDLRPFGSAQIRLLRPLAHPELHDRLELTSGWKLGGHSADTVIVDRLWRPDVTTGLARELVTDIRRSGARFIYALDDDLLNLSTPYARLTHEDRRTIVEFFLREADGVITATCRLKQLFGTFNENCIVVPNALDEQLIAGGKPSPVNSPFGRRRKVIGYMGTMTHDADLELILPAWQTIYNRYGSEIEFQIVGVSSRPHVLRDLDLPIRILAPHKVETEYPLFMLWFTSRLCWDIAISPLQDTAFNRCKSDIKFLDYCALRAAGIFSDVPAYCSSVRHLETGWLAGNTVDAWILALDTLLMDDELRSKLAANAGRYLHTNRTLRRSASLWLNAIEELVS